MSEEKKLLENIIKDKDKILERIEEARKKLTPKANIISILGYTRYEEPNSSLLYNILKVNFKHNDKEINFAKDFSNFIIKEKLNDNSIDLNPTEVKASIEEYASKDSGRRIDILIQSDNFEIIIENKIDAGDQENQLKDYYENRKNENKDKQIFLVYLTRWGNKPSEYSINKELREKLESENKILCLSHNDMGEWIEEHILKNKNYEFLKDEEYQSIYSALIQIKDNEKTISKTSEESKMEKQEIKNFFEDNKYFDLLLKGANDSDTKKIEELNKSIKFFEDVNEAIKEKKSDIILSIESVKEGIKYSLDVANYLKNKGVNIWSKYGGINEEQLRKNMSNGCYSFFCISIIDKWKLQVYLDQRISDLSVGIFSDNVNIINKLSDEAIKNEIEKILENCEYVEDYEYYEYCYYQSIDITKEGYPTAEETANKMIALYDLLNKLKDKIIQ